MSKNTKIEWCDHTTSPAAPINPATGRPGPAPKPARDGDKVQARQRINVEVRSGRRPHPNALPCEDCGHVHVPGERRHEYDHYLGYAAEHHLEVQPVCTLCHAKRDSARAKKTHCIHGHAFDEQNTYVAGNGTRHCRACMKLREKTRPPRGSDYWARVNAKRRGKKAAGRLLDGRAHDDFPMAASLGEANSASFSRTLKNQTS